MAQWLAQTEAWQYFYSVIIIGKDLHSPCFAIPDSSTRTANFIVNLFEACDTDATSSTDPRAAAYKIVDTIFTAVRYLHPSIHSSTHTIFVLRTQEQRVALRKPECGDMQPVPHAPPEPALRAARRQSFTVELVVLLNGQGFEFFQSGWNIFDGGILTGATTGARARARDLDRHLGRASRCGLPSRPPATAAAASSGLGRTTHVPMRRALPQRARARAPCARRPGTSAWR